MVPTLNRSRLSTSVRRRPVHAWTAGVLVSAGVVSLLSMPSAAQAGTGAPIAAAPAVKAAGSDVTSPLEARRVDSVKVTLKWIACGKNECATVPLPLDYDAPGGPTIPISMVRIKATNPTKKIGTLFYNPGGPGGVATEGLLSFAPALSATVRANFDLVAIDPRGVGTSFQVRCFADGRDRRDFTDSSLNRNFPFGQQQIPQAIADARIVGQACSNGGRPLVGAMSTAQSARDMDVIRRAVGDSKLNFLGFSYGTYLGQVYANLFPDRVRTLVIDGVLDPVAWAGTPATQAQPVTDRLQSGAAGWRALEELDDRCFASGLCAKRGDVTGDVKLLMARLKEKPLINTERFLGPRVITYQYFVGLVQSLLRTFPQGVYAYASSFLAQYSSAGSAQRSATAQMAAIPEVTRRLAANLTATGDPFDDPNRKAYWAVMCSDSLNSAKIADFASIADAADRRAPGLGRLWTWASSPCAADAWSARDDDAYRGTFTHRTSAPVLVIGNYWDPITPYAGAQAAANLLPNSRLLSSNSWGHTAYGTSTCVTGAVDRYLLGQQVPAANTVCQGDDQPYSRSSASAGAGPRLSSAANLLP